jgi:hypothetical protein
VAPDGAVGANMLGGSAALDVLDMVGIVAVPVAVVDPDGIADLVGNAGPMMAADPCVAAFWRDRKSCAVRGYC